MLGGMSRIISTFFKLFVAKSERVNRAGEVRLHGEVVFRIEESFFDNRIHDPSLLSLLSILHLCVRAHLLKGSHLHKSRHLQDHSS